MRRVITSQLRDDPRDLDGARVEACSAPELPSRMSRGFDHDLEPGALLTRSAQGEIIDAALGPRQ